MDDVSFSLDRGETLALLGPSGSGKTTLLRVIAGLAVPDSGEVVWQGVALGSSAAHTRNFGLVFQDYALFPHLDVAANVGFGLQIAGLPHEVIAARVAEMLNLVGLEGFGDRSTDTLSGGQRQRVAMARALAPNPRLLMLDEPVGALDRHLRRRLMADLAEIVDNLSTPVVYVTHDQAEAFALADRVAILDRGRLLQVGSPEEVWWRPASIDVTNFLGHDNVVEVRATGGVIATPWGAVHAQLSPGPHLVAIPAIAVHIDRLGPISAVVERTVFADGHHRVELVALNHPLIAEVVGQPPQPGSTVSVMIDPDGIIDIPVER